MPDRAQLHQITIAGLILGKQNQMIDRLILAASPLLAGACRDIGLATDNRFDALRQAGFIERNGTIHHAMIRQGQRFHAKRRRFPHQVTDTCRSIEQTVITMHVQMHERAHRNAFLSPVHVYLKSIQKYLKKSLYHFIIITLGPPIE